MNEQTAKTIRVWDPLVRLFHWSLLLVFIIAYVTGEEESGVHAYSGYIILGLISFRVLWGYVGSTYARFGNFIYSPKAILEYLKSLLTGQPRHYAGHNPAGGLMVFLLLITLFMASFTGLKAYGVEGHGPLAADAPQISLINTAYADDDRHDYEEDEHDGEEHDEGKNEKDEFWEEVHEANVNFLLFLIILHVAGVFVSSHLHKENLVRAMITGRKLWQKN